MIHSLILPMLVQVLLTLAVMFWLAYTRFSVLLRADGMKKVRKDGFPVRALNASDNFKNQFEIPVLFYALCLLMITTELESQGAVIAAWVFIAARVVHAFVHLTKNIIFPWRFLSFFISALCVVVMAVIAFINLVNI